MFGWWKKQKRKYRTAATLPKPWLEILRTHASYLPALDYEQQAKVFRSIQILVHEKNWEGCNGLRINDRHRVTIAAQIARMTLGFEEEYFDEVKSILVYPDDYVAESKTQLGSMVIEGRSRRAGEAWYRGPVILSWTDVRDSAIGYPNGHNVVIHEFAHQLDMRNGSPADGVPVLESKAEAKAWVEAMSAGLARLRQLLDSGEDVLIDAYGATSESEFFAVTSELFFESPLELSAEWPDVYRVMQSFYKQDPRHYLEDAVDFDS